MCFCTDEEKAAAKEAAEAKAKAAVAEIEAADDREELWGVLLKGMVS